VVGFDARGILRLLPDRGGRITLDTQALRKPL